MDHITQRNALRNLLGLKAEGSAFLDETVTHAPVEDYVSAERFNREQKRVFRALPQPVIHVSELPDPGSYKAEKLHGLPLLLTRDKEGRAHAFLNVCRHRGARLVEEGTGCKHAFSCPYHAWTYGSDGALRGMPHAAQGFPDFDKATHGLTRLPSFEAYGFLWVIPSRSVERSIEEWIAPVGEDLSWLAMDALKIRHSDTLTIGANWKLLVEGGIEAYHFKIAHRDTIGPFFEDNLSSYEMLGPHMRSVLPRATLGDLAKKPEIDWDIREEANVVYTLFPLSQLLVQQDHIVWIRIHPLAADKTELRLSLLAPDTTPLSDDPEKHWAQNHRITLKTLTEDFEIGEGIQDGLASGANTQLTFGRYEGALDALNRMIKAYL